MRKVDKGSSERRTEAQESLVLVTEIGRIEFQ